MKLNSVSQKKPKTSTVIVDTTSNRARLWTGEVRRVGLDTEFHWVGMIKMAVVRVAGAARHSIGDSLGGCRLAGEDVCDSGLDGVIDAPGIVEEAAYLGW